MICAYADPPYVGQSKKHYGRSEVNHRLLIAYLCSDFPEGWALSCSSSSLQQLLPLCPADIRIGAWVKTFAKFKPGVNPTYAWEPVIFRGGRNRHPQEIKIFDWCAVSSVVEYQQIVGQKPEAFCFWLFRCLGLQGDDDLVDLFPGSGAVLHAWNQYRRQIPLFTADTSQQPELVL